MDMGNTLIPMNAPGAISPPSAFLIQRWLVKFAEIFEVDLSEKGPRYVSLWVEALGRIAPEILDLALARLLVQWRPEYGRKFPVPSDVTALIGNVRELQTEEQAETIWERVLAACVERYHPDLGWRGPKLEERVFRAIGAAGGVHYVTQCSSDDLVWAKKRFIEAYLRLEKLDDVTFLPAPEIRELFKPLAEQKSLPALNLTPQQIEQRRHELLAAIEKAAPPRTVVIELSDEDLARKKAELKQKALDWAQENLPQESEGA